MTTTNPLATQPVVPEPRYEAYQPGREAEYEAAQAAAAAATYANLDGAPQYQASEMYVAFAAGTTA